MRGSGRIKDICCSKCNYVTDKRSLLNAHKHTHKRSGAFRCPICKYASKREFWLEIHYLFNPHHEVIYYPKYYLYIFIFYLFIFLLQNSEDSGEEHETGNLNIIFTYNLYANYFYLFFFYRRINQQGKLIILFFYKLFFLN